MASDARKLLDEQIASLKSLGSAAGNVYLQVAQLPSTIKLGHLDIAVRQLADTIVEDYKAVDYCWDRAGHWLGPSNPISVPCPITELISPSACGGAHKLIWGLSILASYETNTSFFQLDKQTLHDALLDRWQSEIPNWLAEIPVTKLKCLAEVSRQEVNDAIARLTKEFYAAASTTNIEGGKAADREHSLVALHVQPNNVAPNPPPNATDATGNDAASSPSGESADDEPPTADQSNAKLDRRTPKDEANLRAREALKGKPPKGERWSVRKLAKAIGCSPALANELDAWRVHPDRQSAANTAKPPTERRSTLDFDTVAAVKADHRADDPAAIVAAVDELQSDAAKQAELQRLIAEQAKDAAQDRRRRKSPK